MSKKAQNSTVTHDEIEVSDELFEPEVPSRAHEVFGVVCAILGLITMLALFSYDGLDHKGSAVTGGNLVGPAGIWISYILFSAFGAASYMVGLVLLVFAALLIAGYADRASLKNAIGTLVIIVLSSIALFTIIGEDTIKGGHSAGGLAGTFLGTLGLSFVSTTGTCILTVGGILVTLLAITDISLFLLLRTIGILTFRGTQKTWSLSRRVVRAWISELPEDEEEPIEQSFENVEGRKKDETRKEFKDKSLTEEPRIVTKEIAERKAKKKKADDLPKIDQSAKGEFTLPSLNMLKEPDSYSMNIDESFLKENASRLSEVLSDFGIEGEVREIHPGPVVTMFEFQPRSGTKLSRIGGLSNEIAMALEVERVRIIAPIPGKNAVGFELPNREREMVRLREILEDRSYSESKARLPMGLGKDISGVPYTADLAQMPHLLMAGTTGSGKSVSVNTMLLSYLFKYTPEDLRLLLIDPKMIEFQPYNEIPHLLLPVVTDMSQACLALKWAVDEMERRYQLFADMGSKNLKSYNKKVEKVLKEAERKESETGVPEVQRTETGSVVEFGQADVKPAEKLPQKLPLIVICIDELADLMMVSAKDVENSIARLAQKARASGIHLIVATQRPSTDVVTGLIKSNFPARLSCQVSSSIDSRTILGNSGAEKLLGNGDMLLKPPGRDDFRRLQGAFVSEEEVADVVDFLKKQQTPQYDEEILKPRDDENADGDLDDEKDQMYDQAVAIVAQAQSCSISMLQRKLKIGYNRSARMVDIMEKEGVVGPANGSSRREVLVSPQ